MKTQADGVKKMMERERFIQAMQTNGYKVQVGKNSTIIAKRMSNTKLVDNTPSSSELVFVKDKMIKGARALFSTKFYEKRGGFICLKSSGARVDSVAI